MKVGIYCINRLSWPISPSSPWIVFESSLTLSTVTYSFDNRLKFADNVQTATWRFFNTKPIHSPSSTTLIRSFHFQVCSRTSDTISTSLIQRDRDKSAHNHPIIIFGVTLSLLSNQHVQKVSRKLISKYLQRKPWKWRRTAFQSPRRNPRQPDRRNEHHCGNDLDAVEAIRLHKLLRLLVKLYR